MAGLATIAVLSLSSAMVGLFVVAIRRRDTAAAVNALLSLLLTSLPVALEVTSQTVLGRAVVFGPVLPIWIGVAGVLHSLGMVGLYESTWWWDHLTHTVSAALVAALLYAAIITQPDPTGPVTDPGTVRTVTVGFTVAVGVFWELIELLAREVGARFDVEPVLVYYGWRDTVADLGFDVLGALLVVGLDLRVFVPVAGQFPRASEAAVLGSGVAVLGGSAVLALVVVVASSRRS